MGRIITVLAALGTSVIFAVSAHAEPAPPPTPDMNGPKCLTLGGGPPFPHLQYLPCGWDWDGANWIPKP